jgi:hypothetical protein
MQFVTDISKLIPQGRRQDLLLGLTIVAAEKIEDFVLDKFMRTRPHGFPLGLFTPGRQDA